MKRRRTRPTTPNHRLGFTLIELLVVIVILGLLIGLLLPAVMNAVNGAKDASVAAEIRAMSQALADFNSKYSSYPPSRIVISETGDYNAATLGAAAPLAQRSMTSLRKVWPRLQFNTSGTAGYASGLTASNFYDVNGNGKMDGVYILTGPECLVLFLGGIPQSASGGAGWSVSGFSKNPLNPFQGPTFTTNRTIPLFEFNNSRLVSNTTNATTSAITDSSGAPWIFPGYIDSLGPGVEPTVIPFYAYFSAYNGAGYDPDDVDFSEPNSAGTVAKIAGAFRAPNTVRVPVPAGNIIASLAPNPYTNDVPVPTLASGDVNAGGAKSIAWQNANSFQIISPGRDRVFGIGGQYLPNGNDRLPFVNAVTGYTPNSFQTQQANATVTGITTLNLGTDIRIREKDNVTNFSPGKLD